MQYNGKFINPYEVLGLPHASDFELVKATYRSLVKIYHPDVFKGDKEFAKERLSQLNAAHEFLSDEQQKQDFDKSPQSQEKGEAEQSFDPDQNTNEFDEGIKILKENWDYACDYYPDLKRLYADLRSLGKEPAFAFMAYVVETKKYKEAATIAKLLKNAFLTKKFGDDETFKYLAQLALKERQVGFAKELNRAVRILGVGSKKEILLNLSEKFHEFTYRSYTAGNCADLISPKNPFKIREEENQKKEKKRWEKEKLKIQKASELENKKFLQDFIFYIFWSTILFALFVGAFGFYQAIFLNGPSSSFNESSNNESQFEPALGKNSGPTYAEYHYPNGELMFRERFLDGESRFYYQNGQLKRVRQYKAGKICGMWSKYNEDGELEWHDYKTPC